MADSTTSQDTRGAVRDLASIFGRPAGLRAVAAPRPAPRPQPEPATLPRKPLGGTAFFSLADSALAAVRDAVRRGVDGLLEAEVAVRGPEIERRPAVLESAAVEAPAFAPLPVVLEPEVLPDTFLAPVLRGDFDAQGRLVVSAGWLVPAGGGRPERLLPPGRATPEAVVEGGFGEDEGGALRLLEAVPAPLRAAFAAPPRVFEGDAIPDALAALRADPAFHGAPRVRACRVIDEAPRLERLDLSEDGPGWLELDVRYRSGPHAVSLGEVLAASGARYLRVGDDFVPAPRGALVDEARAAALASGTGTGTGTGTGMKGLTLPALAVLRALAREPERPAAAAFGGTARALAAIAAGAEPARAPEPLGYTGTLKPHQRQGLDWLWSLREARLGGILADEMGLGKTHMTLALIACARGSGTRAPSLVVAPTSVLEPWLDRALEFAPGLTPVRYFGPEREGALEGLSGSHLVVTTYGVLVRDQDRLAAIEWEVAALDEAHRVKNPDTEAFRAARRLSARMRLAITGTPVENRPGEVRALLEYAVPGYLPPADRFEEIERAVLAGEADAVEHLRRLVHPFKLRRRKKDVLPDLPSKREETRFCELSEAQAALYREVLAEAKSALRGGTSIVAVLAALTRLKRLCDHPSLVLPDGRGKELPSGKLAALEAILADAAAAGRKVVVFSQYLEMLDLIEERCAALGLRHEDLRGSTRDRAGAIRRFQTDAEVRVMCVSLLAGGVGIDLTAGDLVVHFDRWWNAAREDQATDRVHRIGQTKDVEVLRLVTRGTLEERIDAIISRKARLLDDVVEADDPALARSLGREEIAALLEAA